MISLRLPGFLVAHLTGAHSVSIYNQLEADDNESIVKLSRHQQYRRSNVEYIAKEQRRNQSRDRSEYNGERRDRRAHRPFVGWDTEGTNINATPFLFGSSEGHRIAHPEISGDEMFDLILECEDEMPDAIHIIFGGEYDFNMMFRNMERKYLWALRQFGKCTWGEYKIEHVPRKWVQIKRGETIARVYDVQAFFGTSFVNALVENDIGDPTELARVITGKAGRQDFSYGELSVIEPYWRTELKLLPLLMDKLRDAFYRAGVYIHHWHGPGAIARHMLRTHDIKQAMAESPPEVHLAARYAFCGGRFEPFQAGLYDGTIYNADINSAYPYAATLVPNLAKGRWIHRTDIDRQRINPEAFTVYHIRYRRGNPDHSGLCFAPEPLFRRYHDDRVMWPNSVTGWYWSPEAYNVRDNPFAEYLEAWEFIPDNVHDKPFAWLNEYFDRRLTLKRLGDPMQLTYKLGINSVYGQTAQRAGWQRYNGPPTFHQLEWAGFITSVCRAMIYRAATAAWESNSLISIDTDGIYTTAPIDVTALTNGTGDLLGQWGMEELDGMLNWQSGVYWIKENDEWKLKKSRGAPKGQIPFEAAMKALPEMKDIRYTRNELMGYRLALRNGFDEWRYFTPKKRALKFGGSEFSKRYHNERGCRLCRGFVNGTMHDLFPLGNGFGFDNHSTMHVLPWEKANDHERPREYNELKTEIELDAIWSEEP